MLQEMRVEYPGVTSPHEHPLISHGTPEDTAMGRQAFERRLEARRRETPLSLKAIASQVRLAAGSKSAQATLHRWMQKNGGTGQDTKPWVDPDQE